MTTGETRAMALMDSLLNLFQVDAQVRGLRSRLQSAERYFNAQSGHVTALEQQKSELKARKKQLTATIANHETDLACIDERLEKLRNDLNNSVTNKQYTAVLTEMNTVKLQRKEVESTVLELMEQVETIEAEVGEVETQITERIKVREIATTQLDERKTEIGDRLAELEREREAAAAEIPEAERRLFNKLADDYDGEAMAKVEEVSRRHREYACGACSLQIPFERVATLTSNANTLVSCASCHRILYIEEETKAALTN
jgi:predicted  nucleic acid-binding Zn-ribbon protein